jgi:hypothetical protein
MPETRATVSLSPEAGAIASEIRERYRFTDLMDVARFGVAVAVAHQISPDGGRTPGPASGTWNLGSLDRDSELRNLIKVLYPDQAQDPSLALETLMDKGLILLGKLIKSNHEPTLMSLVEHSRQIGTAPV